MRFDTLLLCLTSSTLATIAAAEDKPLIEHDRHRWRRRKFPSRRPAGL
jgi:hypothetical protein